MAITFGGRFPDSLKNPQWSEIENVEMAARVMVRRGLTKILAKELQDVDTADLESVLFEIVFPTVW